MSPQNETPRGVLTVSPNQTAFTPDQIDAFGLHDASEADRNRFLHIVQKTGLDPAMRQIYAIGRWNGQEGRKVFTPQTSIDGYRQIAHRTGLFAGVDTQHNPDPKNPSRPFSVQVTVYRLTHGVKAPFTATAFFDEYNAGTSFWKKMPWRMIEKCAEALALRMAFPDELSGVYTAEEMAQADHPAPAVQDHPEVIHETAPAPTTEVHNRQVKGRMVEILTGLGLTDPLGKAKELWLEAGLSLDPELVVPRDVADALIGAADAVKWETDPVTETGEGDPVQASHPDPVQPANPDPVQGHTGEINPSNTYQGDPLDDWTPEESHPETVTRPVRSNGSPQPTGQLISEKQLRFLGSLAARLRLSDEQLYEKAGDITGRVITSRNELTRREASDLIDELNESAGPR